MKARKFEIRKEAAYLINRHYDYVWRMVGKDATYAYFYDPKPFLWRKARKFRANRINELLADGWIHVNSQQMTEAVDAYNQGQVWKGFKPQPEPEPEAEEDDFEMVFEAESTD